jgi:hypothetical protein
MGEGTQIAITTEDRLFEAMQKAIAEWQPTNADLVNFMAGQREEVEGMVSTVLALKKETRTLNRKVDLLVEQLKAKL